ncbi:hypothetical protein [Streptomyces sp. NPDC048603]|uniref:hypothetical protein n=1 Tax=Streptomyces sp. NPDC048603 TaxID=3365577 RepID=UPI00372138BE
MLSAFFALLTLAALAGPVALRLRKNPAFITGRDGRLSTSTTLALAWTVLLVWLLLVSLGYGMFSGEGIAWFHRDPDGPFSALTTVYLPLLGGPYAALIAAKAVVGMRVQQGSLAKPGPAPAAGAGAPAARPVRDLIANDSGRTDLVDLQYVALSLVTMAYVVVFFLADVGGGLPRLPEQIWALTGAPAGAYLLNKMAGRANPVITDVRQETPGGPVTVSGGGFQDASVVTFNETGVPARLEGGRLVVDVPGTLTGPQAVIVTTTGLRSDPYAFTPAAAPATSGTVSPASPAVGPQRPAPDNTPQRPAPNQ